MNAAQGVVSLAPSEYELVETNTAGTSLQHLLLDEASVRAVSGIAKDDVALLSPQAERAEHAGIAALVGLCVGVVAGLALVPDSRTPALAFLGVAVVAYVASIAEQQWLVVASGIGAVGAAGWTVWRILASGTTSSWLAFGAAILAGGGVYLAIRAHRTAKRSKGGFAEVADMHGRVERYNKLVRALELKEQLIAAQGRTADARARANALRGLTATRENLLRTLRVERLVRENRSLISEVGLQGLGEDLVPVDAMRVQVEADEYARVVEETLDMASNLQAAFDELQSDSAR